MQAVRAGSKGSHAGCWSDAAAALRHITLGKGSASGSAERSNSSASWKPCRPGLFRQVQTYDNLPQWQRVLTRVPELKGSTAEGFSE
eukprot:363403-Chlamydomonas_euryale.AAC.28